MIGIDLGSRTVKIVQQDEKTTQEQIYDSNEFFRRFSRAGEGRLRIDLESLGFHSRDRLVATGYNKFTAKVEGIVHLPEVQAQVKGAVRQTGLTDFSLLDIGGSHIRIISVNRGTVAGISSHALCASGTGRYLENMAATLGMSLDELAAFSEDPFEPENRCALLGEVELLTRLVEGISVRRLAAGVNYAVYRSCETILQNAREPNIILAGGVSLNPAVARIIAQETSRDVIRLPKAQLNAAIGCCVYGEEIFGR